MRQTLKKEISNLLQKDQSKKAIYETPLTDTNRNELVNLLNCMPTTVRINKTILIITLFLIILLTMLTIKQCLSIYLHENSNISLILGFIAPIIHIYVIRELMHDYRLAYQILPPAFSPCSFI